MEGLLTGYCSLVFGVLSGGLSPGLLEGPETFFILRLLIPRNYGIITFPIFIIKFNAQISAGGTGQ